MLAASADTGLAMTNAQGSPSGGPHDGLDSDGVRRFVACMRSTHALRLSALQSMALIQYMRELVGMCSQCPSEPEGSGMI